MTDAQAFWTCLVLIALTIAVAGYLVGKLFEKA